MQKLILAFLLLSLSSAHAQKLDSGATPFNATGTVNSSLPIREAPPHGPFNLFLGKEIEITNKGQEVKIIGKKSYSGFSGAHIWYQLERDGTQSTNFSKPMWLYGGVEGKAPQIKINDTKE